MGAVVGSGIVAAVDVSAGVAAAGCPAVGASVGITLGAAALLDESPLSGSALAPQAINVAINTPAIATSRYFAGLKPATALALGKRLPLAVGFRLVRGAPVGGRLRRTQRSDDVKSANSSGMGFVWEARVRCALIGNPLADAGFGNLPQQPSPNADAARRHEAKPCWNTCARPSLRKGATKTAVAR